MMTGKLVDFSFTSLSKESELIQKSDSKCHLTIVTKYEPMIWHHNFNIIWVQNKEKFEIVKLRFLTDHRATKLEKNHLLTHILRLLCDHLRIYWLYHEIGRFGRQYQVSCVTRSIRLWETVIRGERWSFLKISNLQTLTVS